MTLMIYFMLIVIADSIVPNFQTVDMFTLGFAVWLLHLLWSKTK